MLKHLPTLLLSALVASCAAPTLEDPPVDFDRLAPALADMQLAEALTSEVPVVLRDSLREVFYDNVLADHKYGRAEFDSLMWIVRQEPAWVDSLYSRAGVVLAQKSAE